MQDKVIPEEIKKKIEGEAAKRFPILDISKDAPRNSRRNQARFIEGGIFVYSLCADQLKEAMEEIERLKKLIKKMYCEGIEMPQGNDWQQFKIDNGL